jgi:hypothetical protein
MVSFFHFGQRSFFRMAPGSLGAAPAQCHSVLMCGVTSCYRLTCISCSDLKSAISLRNPGFLLRNAILATQSVLRDAHGSRVDCCFWNFNGRGRVSKHMPSHTHTPTFTPSLQVMASHDLLDLSLSTEFAFPCTEEHQE